MISFNGCHFKIISDARNLKMTGKLAKLAKVSSFSKSDAMYVLRRSNSRHPNGHGRVSSQIVVLCIAADAKIVRLLSKELNNPCLSGESTPQITLVWVRGENWINQH